MKKHLVFILISFVVWSVNAQQEKEPFNKKAREQYEAFKRQAKENYDSFRDSANKSYAEFVERAWKTYKGEEPFVQQEEKPLPPVIMPEEEKNIPLQDNAKPIEEFIKPQPVTPQPQPIEPIKEEKKDDDKEQTFSFMFYGTDIRTTFFDDYKFSLQGVETKDIAEAWKNLSSSKYKHLINECLRVREEYVLNDWAYLQMLDKFSENIIGRQSNEATLLMAYLYCQSGYKMRLAESDKKLYMLYSSKSIVYGVDYFIVDADLYYLYKGEKLEYVKICEASFPQEKEMSFQLRKQPLFSIQTSSYRELKSERYPEVKANVRVNKNLIDFYDKYPTSTINRDFGTRWAMYANAPLSDEVKETLYPALQKSLQGKTKKEKAEILLNFVQTSLVYEYDDTVWGTDRAFFAEETLFYPYADCEDRAILYSRLVRDLLGIKAVLIYYPNHLATAICLDTPEVKGDYILVNDKKYYIADPTYIGAPIGVQMSELKDESIKVISLD
ncbi:MAG: transglutaminase domain-containing protein [Bacteroidales bacterium]|nr:transglutaminase domain-containing protein [Bacteroidales bacterium]